MRIILLGPPGAGKGTQAKSLAKKLNLPHISTGELLRLNVREGTELGKLAKGIMDKGALVPDALVTSMLKERFNQSDIKKGFILDGYPRNLNQAKTLDKILGEKDALDMVIYLETSQPIIIQRLSGRLVCRSCGANFHIKNMPPKRADICDNCGARLYQRTDDQEETVKNRLKVYLKKISPLIQYYQTKQKLYRIVADEDKDTVLNKIIHLIEEYDDSLKV